MMQQRRAIRLTNAKVIEGGLSGGRGSSRAVFSAPVAAARREARPPDGPARSCQIEASRCDEKASPLKKVMVSGRIIPAQAGIQVFNEFWTPACAGVTARGFFNGVLDRTESNEITARA
jgi:hypothetical protein